MRAIQAHWTPEPLGALEACRPAVSAWMASVAGSASGITIGAGSWAQLVSDASPEGRTARSALRDWWSVYPLPEIDWVLNAALLPFVCERHLGSGRFRFIVGLSGQPAFRPRLTESNSNGGSRRPVYEPGLRDEYRRSMMHIFRRELDGYMDAVDAAYGVRFGGTSHDADMYALRARGETYAAIAAAIRGERYRESAADATRKAIELFARRADLPFPKLPRRRAVTLGETLGSRVEKGRKITPK